MLTFIAAIAALVFFIVLGYDPSQLVSDPPLNYCIAIIVASTIASAVASYFYFTFKNPRVKAGVNEGFKFGLTMLVVGIVLDMLFFLPMIISSGNLAQLSNYYGKIYVYFVFAGVLAGSVGVGWWLAKK